MAAQHKEDASSKDSSETDVPGDEKASKPSGTKELYNNEDEAYDNLNYPSAWKFEKWFIGGYSQFRMLKFKKPKTMYTAINLFAGKNRYARTFWHVLISYKIRCCHHVLWLRSGSHVSSQPES